MPVINLPFNYTSNPVATTHFSSFTTWRAFTAGWEFGLSAGDEVLAIADGVVIDSRDSVPDGDSEAAYTPNPQDGSAEAIDNLSIGSGGVGNFITIRHEKSDGSFYYSSYYHLQEGSIDVGTNVSAGDIIGKAGNTGVRTSSNLTVLIGDDVATAGEQESGYASNTENGRPISVASLTNYSAISPLFDTIQFEGYNAGQTALPHLITSMRGTVPATDDLLHVSVQDGGFIRVAPHTLLANDPDSENLILIGVHSDSDDGAQLIGDTVVIRAPWGPESKQFFYTAKNVMTGEISSASATVKWHGPEVVFDIESVESSSNRPELPEEAGFVSQIASTPDGRFVVFQSSTADFVETETGGIAHIYLFDSQENNTTLISKNSAGDAGNSHSYAVGISDDGNLISFTNADSG